MVDRDVRPVGGAGGAALRRAGGRAARDRRDGGDGRGRAVDGAVRELPEFGGIGPAERFRPEVGLYWGLASAHRGRGYATEAAAALIDHGFREMRLARIVATTTRDNLASIAVMRRLGMRVELNPPPATAPGSGGGDGWTRLHLVIPGPALAPERRMARTARTDGARRADDSHLRVFRCLPRARQPALALGGDGAALVDLRLGRLPQCMPTAREPPSGMYIPKRSDPAIVREIPKTRKDAATRS